MNSRVNYLVYGFLALVIVAILALGLLYFLRSKGSNTANEEGISLKKTKLTKFDIKLAKRFMDKDENRQCDVCGMDVKICIETGQIQCNMTPKSKIGVLGTQHIHADWKIYVNGKPLEASFFESLGKKSSFIQVDRPKNSSEQAGDVLHVRAKGVPLWLFFESIGGKFNKTTFSYSKEQRFSNGEGGTLKFYVNGVPNETYRDYSPNNLDKILISYGNVNEDVREQINSVTDFAKGY